MQPAFDSFASHRRGRDRLERTVQGCLDALRAFVRGYEQTNGETFLPENPTPTAGRAYRQWLVSHQAVPASVNRLLKQKWVISQAVQCANSNAALAAFLAIVQHPVQTQV